MTFRITPDGARYVRMGLNQAEPMPFCIRPLLPLICRDSMPRWIAATTLGLIASIVLTGVLALSWGATQEQALVAMALVSGLPLLRFSFFAPVLVDMPAMALALGAALLWPISVELSLVVAAVAGLVSEKAPIWAAVFALQPWLLAGLVTPVLLFLLMMHDKDPDPNDPLADTLRHPIRSSMKWHAGKWRDPRAMLLPWGACLVVVVDPSWVLLIALAVGYAQLLVATDTVRLYQQAAPVVCIAAAFVIPTEWALPVVLAHWFNPWLGDGV